MWKSLDNNWSGFHPWTYFDRSDHQDEDEQNRGGETWLSPLCQEVQQIREETQEHVCSSVSMLQRCPGWRCSHRWRVQVIYFIAWVYIFFTNSIFPMHILCIVFKILKLPQNFSPKLGYFQKNEENMPKIREKYKNQR